MTLIRKPNAAITGGGTPYRAWAGWTKKVSANSLSMTEENDRNDAKTEKNENKSKDSCREDYAFCFVIHELGRIAPT